MSRSLPAPPRILSLPVALWLSCHAAAGVGEARERPPDLLDFGPENIRESMIALVNLSPAPGLDGAVRRLSEEKPRAAQVLRLRFFAGLTIEETARVLNASRRTIELDWAYARAWLYRRLSMESEHNG